MMFFLLNGETGNQVGTYTTQESALGDIRRAVAQHGRNVTDAWMLMRQDDDGELDIVADRTDLAVLAERAPENVSA